MATKLKRYNPALKAAAFILMVALSVTAVVGCSSVNIWNNSLDYLGKTDFTETGHYWWYMNDAQFTVERLTEILNGETPYNIQNQINDLFYNEEWRIRDNLSINVHVEVPCDCYYDYGEVERDYDYYVEADENGIIMRQNDEVATIDEATYDYNSECVHYEEFSYYPTDREVWDAFKEEYAEEIRNIKNTPEASEEYWIDMINNDDRMIYYVEVGDEIVSNTELSFEQMQKSLEHYYHYDDSVRGKYIIALRESFILEQEQALAAANREFRKFITLSIIWFLAYAVVLAYLLFSAGRKAAPPESGITMTAFDRLFTEGILILIFSVLCLGITVCKSYYWNTATLFDYLYIPILIIGFTIGYALILSVVRHIKNRSLLKNLLLYKAFAGFIKFTRFSYSKGNPMLKIMVMVTVLGLLTMIPFIGFLTVPLALFIAHKHAKDFKKLKTGITAIKDGVYDNKIEIEVDVNTNDILKSEFTLLSQDINQISSGLGDEVERRIKSERFKTELIVNVSHDIRTPLTSLITYADLLKKEETDNENIKKYADVISQKSYRLKTLTDDLFESSKAASGNINVNLENVAVNSLLIQALAEFDEKIKQSALEFKLNIPTKIEHQHGEEYQESITALADGRLLWRVIENLISNTLRYSLEGSRVYIDIRQDHQHVLIEMKNISKAELNIPEDEITERFKRGDLSRNSEGSGLGLDIATSLMRLQGGELSVKIDGDLFKVCVKIPSAK